MPNGKEVGELNVARFVAWREGKTDNDFRKLIGRGVLHREKIAAECGFNQRALGQNPTIRAALEALEEELRHRGVLPPKKLPPSASSSDSAHSAAEVAPNREASTDADAGAEMAPAPQPSDRSDVSELRKRLARYEHIHDVLVATGRFPR